MKDYFSLAFNNLKRRKLRSWLTMIGIFIGIAAVVALISLGQGLQGYITGEFEKLGKDKIMIMPSVFAPPGSITAESLILTDKDLEFIKDINGVKSAIGYVSKYGQVNFKDQSEIVFVGGLAPEDNKFWQEMGFADLEDGRDLRKGEKYKAIVGYNHIYEDLWKKSLQVGDTIEIENQEFKIVGVMEKIGNSEDDKSVFIPKETFREVFDVPKEESVIMVQTASGYDPEDVAEIIEKKLRKFREEKEDQETFTVQTSEQLLETFSNIFAVVQAVLVGIAAISLLVGGIGIMNTMYTSVLERTKEIGTMKAIGAKNSDILWIFLFESGLLGLVGGAIGILIGVGLAKGTEYVATTALGTPFLQASLPLYLIVGALAFSFLIGTASGILPAMQAAKLKPADALRYE
jgi:putative ABC transport system permease protein